jgi:hypothetical protein
LMLGPRGLRSQQPVHVHTVAAGTRAVCAR